MYAIFWLRIGTVIISAGDRLSAKQRFQHFIGRQNNNNYRVPFSPIRYVPFRVTTGDYSARQLGASDRLFGRIIFRFLFAKEFQAVVYFITMEVG
jgi:hypothetical protein